MILPLHHCDAIGCLRLLEPRSIMCRKHWKMVPLATAYALVRATDPKEIARLSIRAQCEVAQAEGLPLYVPLKPDASQASNQPSVSPSAAGIPEGTTS